MTETPEESIYEKTFAKSDATDAILVVDGKKLDVNKALLSVHSDYFKTLFSSDYEEKLMEEIPINDVKFDEFSTLLSFVHPNPLTPTAANAEKLLSSPIVSYFQLLNVIWNYSSCAQKFRGTESLSWRMNTVWMFYGSKEWTYQETNLDLFQIQKTRSVCHQDRSDFIIGRISDQFEYAVLVELF